MERASTTRRELAEFNPTTARSSRRSIRTRSASQRAAVGLELPTLPGPPQIGSKGPGLELDYLPGALAPDASRPTLPFFWASWCRHCRTALPELLAFGDERDVAVVAITDEHPEEVETFLQAYDGPFPEAVATDPRRLSFQKYGVSGTPTFVLVDADGTVRHFQTGYKLDSGLGIDGWQWEGAARPD